MSYRRAERLGRAGVYALALFLALVGLPPVSTSIVSPDELDLSWAVNNYLAFIHHLHYGVSYLWTYGPLGFADNPIEISRFPVAVAVILQVAFAVLLACALVYALRAVGASYPVSVLWVITLLLPGNFVRGSIEFESILLALFLVFFARYPTTAKGPCIIVFEALAGLSAAFAPLVKASLLPVAVVLALACLADDLLRRDWKSLIGFLTCFLATWVAVFALAGGGVRLIPAWLAGESQLIVGYSSMSSAGFPWYLHAAAIVWAGGLTVAAHTLPVLRRRWVSLLSVAFLAFGAFKEGFVRQDILHEFAFFSLATWCALFCWLIARSTGTARPLDAPQAEMVRRRAIRVDAAALCTTLVACFVLFGAMGTVVPSLPGAKGRLSNAQGLFRFLDSAHTADAVRAQGNAQLLRQRPNLATVVPMVRGSNAFAWPWDGNAVVAAGGREVPPPIPQQYSAYTPELDAMDARFFRASHRPPIGLVAVSAIDGRLPLQTAGSSFRSLMACYRPLILSGGLLVSRKHPCTNESPALRSAGPAQEVTLSQWIRVPYRHGVATIARISERPSLFGTALGLAFRRAAPYVQLWMSNGSKPLYRVVAATLPDGILVSSVLGSVTDLADLWIGAPDNRVEALRLTTGRPQEWSNTFRVHFDFMPLPAPTQVTLHPPAVDSAGASVLVAGHIDRIATDPVDPALRIVSGWFYVASSTPPHGNLSVALKGTNGAIVRLPYYRVTRPDVRAALHTKSAMFSGFTTALPAVLWTGEHKLFIIKIHSKRILGSIT